MILWLDDLKKELHVGPCVLGYLLFENMKQAIDAFITYTELNEPTHLGQAECYKQLLLNIATGSWHFPNEFCVWRDHNDPNPL